MIGGLIGSAVHDTSAFGLDAMFPAVILALIVPDLRNRMTMRAALAGAGVALIATPFLPAGLPVLLALAAVLLLGREQSSDETGQSPDEAGQSPDEAGQDSGEAGQDSGETGQESGETGQEFGEHPVVAR